MYFWRLGDRWQAQRNSAPAPATTPAAQPAASPHAAAAAPVAANAVRNPRASVNGKYTLHDPRLPYRLSNTTASFRTLLRSDTALLLENAIIDTARPIDLDIPQSLKSNGDPGSYIVQARGPIKGAFRQMLANAGATVVSYIPNDAYLVRASASVSQTIAADPLTQAVTPFEPYYKLSLPLLSMTMQQIPVPLGQDLKVAGYPNNRSELMADLQQLGGQITSEDRSPFGPVFTVANVKDAAAVAGLASVQLVELVRPRIHANDLSRQTMTVATDTQVTSNYLDLTGSNVLVAMGDTGVDTNHPDLKGRVSFIDPAAGVDTDGHGTHVAGTIAGDGTKSDTVTNASGSINPGVVGQYRGMAPGAHLLSLSLNMADFALQQTAARSNAPIENNSWNYGVNEYDIAAASYDWAVRDADPFRSGDQPLNIVFSAGNAGVATDDSGQGGINDTILSPATAKDVITVGAVDQERFITNETVTFIDENTTNGVQQVGQTNTPWLGETSANDLIAAFSSRGNVGVNVEGKFGRFKPDVVAPGVFVVSDRSAQWDQAAYYNPIDNVVVVDEILTNLAFSTVSSVIPIPANATKLTITANSFNGPPMQIYLATTNFPNPPAPTDISESPANPLVVTTELPPNTGSTFWYYVITNATPNALAFQLIVDIAVTNNNGNTLQVKSNLDNSVGQAPGYYRYETGTSMAAANASGVLALMKEYCNKTGGMSNASPALLKALMINGARSLGNSYNLQVQNDINYQGWGMIQLTNSIAPTLFTNGTSAAMLAFDQSISNVLATGETQTRIVKLSASARFNPMRVTLVWTDPPGNPAAGVKLVNDLDLVVTDLDNSSNVYFGNDITADFNSPAFEDTNSTPNIDSVNNVENVFLNSATPLASQYEITVKGHRVNVNAVNGQTNRIGQDYALVISCDDPTVSDAFTLVTATNFTANSTNVDYITNSFQGDTSDFGSVLLGQHVGANLPGLSDTSLLNSTNGSNALSPIASNGDTNQWHFYVITNSDSFSNAAFVTFLPQTLSVPRMGVTNEQNPSQITRPEADIDLYATTDAGLLGLDTNAIANAFKSVGRGGTESIVLSNAVAGAVYYIGVKSEDQEAAEYDILADFSLFPFVANGANGEQILRGLPVPNVIPPGSPAKPGGTFVFAIDPEQITVQRVVVTNIITHQQFGNLLGNLSHNQKFAVLNNHSEGTGLNPEILWYEDNGQGDIPGSRQSDGPGSLKNFVGEAGIGVWMLTMVDNVPTGTGQVDAVSIRLDPSIANGGTAVIPPGGVFYDSVDVPLDATNLIICLINESAQPGPVAFGIKRGELPVFSATGGDDLYTNVTAVNYCADISPFSAPPLNPGKYFFGVFNPPSNAPQTIRFQITIQRSANGVMPRILADNTPTTVTKNAVTDLTIDSTLLQEITSISVGVRVNAPELSDLDFTLISPSGTRIQLMENRGDLSTNGAGGAGFSVTNWVGIYTNGFDNEPLGPYAQGTTISGWSVLSNIVTAVAAPGCDCDTNKALALGYGVISNTLPITNIGIYQLSFRVNHTTNLFDTVAWWPFDHDERDIYGGHQLDIYGGHNTLDSGAFAYAPGEVGNGLFADGASTLIEVPRGPDLNVGLKDGFTVEGWIYPLDTNNAMPIVEWNDPTNHLPPLGVRAPLGVQFWLNGVNTNGLPGALAAALWSTNLEFGSTNLAFTSNMLFTVGGAITNNTWQHVALTYDTFSGLASLYINGQLATNALINGQLTNSFPTNSLVPRTEGDLYFASHPAGPLAGRTFNGGLDEFGLYSRALTALEVSNIFVAGSYGKYRHENGTNAYTAPVAVEVQIPGVVDTTFTNGTTWFINGPLWETNYLGTNYLAFTNTLPNSNGIPIIVRGIDPNTVVDAFVVSQLEPTVFNGFLNFTEDASQAFLPIKFAPTPYQSSNDVVTPVFSNDFSGVSVVGQEDFTNGQVFDGWTVTNGTVTVVSNLQYAAGGTNFLALSTSTITRNLATVPGARYQFSYAVRGPCMVSWWNGDLDPLTGRLKDLINLNYGAMINGATNFSGLTNSPGTNIVGTNFVVVGTNAIILTNPPLSKVELGDPQSLALTNSLTIEGWIDPVSLPASNSVGQIFWRGDERGCGAAYSVGLTGAGDLRFHIGDASGATCGTDLDAIGTNFVLTPFTWHSFAAVFDGSRPTNVMSIYLDGTLVAQTNVGIWPFQNLDPGFSPGASIGNRSRDDYSEPFTGAIDELSVYARALTSTEIAALDEAGENGLPKGDPAVAPPEGLAEVQVAINGNVDDVEHGDNIAWSTYTFAFTATDTNTTVTLTGLEPGTLVDSITLTEVPGDVVYLPEQALSELIGETAFGTWTLEVRDDYGTNLPAAEILSWQLNITSLRTTQQPGPVTLQHGIPYTTTLPAFGVQDFIVNVPLWARFATNILQPFATGPVSVTFNQANFPKPSTDLPIIGPLPGGAFSGTTTISTDTNSVPQLIPGQTYYLALTNLNPGPVTFSYEVDFDVMTLTNCTAVTNETAQAGVPRYFAYNVPALSALTNNAATFWLNGARSNLTLVVKRGLPLPDLVNHDYLSDLPNTNDQVIAIQPNTTPFPLTPGTWYIGVFSDTTSTNVPFSFVACYCTNCPEVMELTNAIAQDFTLPPQVTNMLFWHFAISNLVTTNFVTNLSGVTTNTVTNVPASALFEVYNLSGNADLVLQRFALPLQAPFFAGSFRLSTTPEQIVIRTNANLPTLSGDWYLGVPNDETNLVFGTIRATLNNPTNGMLISALPLGPTVVPGTPADGPVLYWNAVEGEHYEVSYSTNLSQPFMVLTSPVVATSPVMATPVPSASFSFFKVRQIP